jgi:hypothetical protein
MPHYWSDTQNSSRPIDNFGRGSRGKDLRMMSCSMCGMCYMPTKQIQTHITYQIVTTLANTEIEMGQHLHGLHHRTSEDKWKGLKEMHASLFVGHPKFLKTYRQLRERFSWKGLKDDVLQYL